MPRTYGHVDGEVLLRSRIPDAQAGRVLAQANEERADEDCDLRWPAA